MLLLKQNDQLTLFPVYYHISISALWTSGHLPQLLINLYLFDKNEYYMNMKWYSILDDCYLTTDKASIQFAFTEFERSIDRKTLGDVRKPLTNITDHRLVQYTREATLGQICIRWNKSGHIKHILMLKYRHNLSMLAISIKSKTG